MAELIATVPMVNLIPCRRVRFSGVACLTSVLTTVATLELMTMLPTPVTRGRMVARFMVSSFQVLSYEE